MKSLFALMVLVGSSSALAGVSPSTCFQACKVLDRSKPYRCMVTASDVGGIMVVDEVEMPGEEDKLRLLALRDCFFSAQGAVFEMHYPKRSPKKFKSCGSTGPHTQVPFTCDMVPESESMRHLKVEE